MDKFNRIYNLIMEDSTEFFGLPYQEQRERVYYSFEQGAPVVWQSLEQFDLFTLLLEFGDEWEKYKDDDWSYQNSKQYAKRLKERIESDSFQFPANDFAYFSTQEKVQKTWQDVADEVWSYYEV